MDFGCDSCLGRKPGGSDIPATFRTTCIECGRIITRDIEPFEQLIMDEVVSILRHAAPNLRYAWNTPPASDDALSYYMTILEDKAEELDRLHTYFFILPKGNRIELRDVKALTIHGKFADSPYGHDPWPVRPDLDQPDSWEIALKKMPTREFWRRLKTRDPP